MQRSFRDVHAGSHQVAVTWDAAARSYGRVQLGLEPRDVTYVHVPVPIDRDDEAYFAPLRDLRRPDGTELYLGLVHVADGVEGTRRRMAAARQIVPEFGIASECGISRGRSRDVAIEFIRVYAMAAAGG